jgi:hypothetical protein
MFAAGLDRACVVNADGLHTVAQPTLTPGSAPHSLE